MEDTDAPVLRILHFNDVYDIQPNANGGAGACFFKAHLDKHRNDRTITLFSGDAFSPSVLSSLFDGQQMVHCLNQFHIDAACYGNHEFDFNINHTEKLAMECNFPWLLGNLIDKRTNLPLGSAKDEFIMIKNGIKIGVFGVAEKEWLDILTEDYIGQLEYKDFIEYSERKTIELRHDKNCQLVIALSHMRYPSNKILCDKVPDLDFILYGHDHNILVETRNGVQMLNSGTNFQHFSVIDIYAKSRKSTYQCHNFSYQVKVNEVCPLPDFDQKLKDYIDEKVEKCREEGERVVGYSMVPLQARFDVIRTSQTNFGDFVVDIIRAFYNCDAATLNAGSIRIHDRIMAGPIKFSVLNNIIDSIIEVKKVPGSILLEMLENSCCMYPAFAGRFLIISGIQYTFDALKPPGSRVVKDSVIIRKNPLDLTTQYTVAMNKYISKGSDGYSCVANCEHAVTTQNGIKLIALFKRFMMIVEEESKVSPNASLDVEPAVVIQHTSSKDTRMSKLMSGVRQENGKYFEEISPITDGRIKILNAVALK